MAEQNWMFISAAYTVTWVVLLGYLVRVHSRLRRARLAYQAASTADAGSGR